MCKGIYCYKLHHGRWKLISLSNDVFDKQEFSVVEREREREREIAVAQFLVSVILEIGHQGHICQPEMGQI